MENNGMEIALWVRIIIVIFSAFVIVLLAAWEIV